MGEYHYCGNNTNVINSLVLDLSDGSFLDDQISENEDNIKPSILTPKAGKGLRMNFKTFMDQSLIDNASLIDISCQEDRESIIESPVKPVSGPTTPKQLLKRIYLNNGKVSRISDHGLTPNRHQITPNRCSKFEKSKPLLKRIYLAEGKIKRISDHGLSPVITDIGLDYNIYFRLDFRFIV